jgi:hypothetical protein
MAVLYTTGGKLLRVGDKLATSSDCCCDCDIDIEFGLRVYACASQDVSGGPILSGYSMSVEVIDSVTEEILLTGTVPSAAGFTALGRAPFTRWTAPDGARVARWYYRYTITPDPLTGAPSTPQRTSSISTSSCTRTTPVQFAIRSWNNPHC